MTDHKPLKWLFNIKDPGSRLMRWRLKLEEFEYEIVYKVEKTNVNTDALSRVPIQQVMQTDDNPDKIKPHIIIKLFKDNKGNYHH